MKISVITPFYQGQEYLEKYNKVMQANAKALEAKGHELEVLVVNDSPWVAVDEREFISELSIDPSVSGADSSPSRKGSLVRLITNEENRGIHYSRVAGLEVATGDYVMFLDQDDFLSDDGLVLMLEEAIRRESEVLVGNANLEQSDGSSVLWYRTDYHKSLVGDLKTYLTVGIQIISPGQCLIKRDVIPQFWCENFVGKNGADDYYLWLLMLAKGLKFDYFDKACYTHHYTNNNLSADTTVTDDSVYDFLELLADCDYFKQEDIFTLHEMISYKNQFRASDKFGKITCSLANLGLFLATLKFKRKTKTGYGFNRG